MGMETVPRGNYAEHVKTNAETERIYTVADLCALTGVSRKTLFFYDQRKLLLPLLRQGPQQAKRYGKKELNRLYEIQKYRSAGLLLKEIRILLDEPEKTEEILLAAYERSERECFRKQQEMEELQKLIAAWQEKQPECTHGAQ